MPRSGIEDVDLPDIQHSKIPINAGQAEGASAELPLAENFALKAQLLGICRQLPQQQPIPDDILASALLSLIKTYLHEQNRHFLWIVDDLPAGLADSAFRQWLVPAVAGRLGHTLITSKSAAYQNKLSPLPLEGLDPLAAVKLLSRLSPPADAPEKAMAEAICHKLGYHALAVFIAAAIINIASLLADAPLPHAPCRNSVCSS